MAVQQNSLPFPPTSRRSYNMEERYRKALAAAAGASDYLSLLELDKLAEVKCNRLEMRYAISVLAAACPELLQWHMTDQDKQSQLFRAPILAAQCLLEHRRSGQLVYEEVASEVRKRYLQMALERAKSKAEKERAKKDSETTHKEGFIKEIDRVLLLAETYTGSIGPITSVDQEGETDQLTKDDLLVGRLERENAKLRSALELAIRDSVESIRVWEEALPDTVKRIYDTLDNLRSALEQGGESLSTLKKHLRDIAMQTLGTAP